MRSRYRISRRLGTVLAAAFLSASALIGMGCAPSLPDLIAAEPRYAGSGVFVLNSSSGDIRVVGRVQHGKLRGPVIFFSRRGDTLGIIDYSDNERNGEARFWYKGKTSGKRRIKFVAHYSNDTLSGAKESYFPDGSLRSRCVYDNGRLVSVRAFDRTGRELGEAEARKLSAADRENDVLMFAQWNKFLANKLQQSD